MRYESPTAREVMAHRAKGGGIETWGVKECRWDCIEVGDGFLNFVRDPDAPQVGMRLIPLPLRPPRPGENVHHVNDPEVRYRIGSEVDEDGMVLVFDPTAEVHYVHPMRYGLLVLDSGTPASEDEIPYRGELT